MFFRPQNALCWCQGDPRQRVTQRRQGLASSNASTRPRLCAVGVTFTQSAAHTNGWSRGTAESEREREIAYYCDMM